MNGDYDYIVVGAGPAGCVVANRLSERHRVLLIEAGGTDSDEWVHVPGGFLQAAANPHLVWMDRTTPGKHVDGRSITLLRGKLLGGGSAVNGMLYVRGQSADYDGWVSAGCPGWSWAEMLPLFRRHTNFPGGDPQVYGQSGELSVGRLPEIHSTSSAFLNAASATGLPRRQDMNGGVQDGVDYVVATIIRGRRQSSSIAFIDPIRDRDTLEVVTDRVVHRVLFDGTRAAGVEVATTAGTHSIACRREIVLSAGAIGSPVILQRSGIGAHDHLSSLGIKVISDVGEVGQNLQDHLFGHLKFRLSSDKYGLNFDFSDPDRCRALLTDWHRNGQGPLVTASSQVLAFFRSDDAWHSPNIQLAMRPLSWHIGASGVPELDPFPGMMASAINTKPYSRGHVRIISNNRADAAEIDTNYFDDERDIDVITAGMRRVREIMAHPAIADRVVAELDPGPEAVSDAQLEEYLRASAATVYHPVGTCRMGSDSAAVVDPRLAVRGVSNLRVIDASVMPTITSGNTMAPSYLIGEKGAELILSCNV